MKPDFEPKSPQSLTIRQGSIKVKLFLGFTFILVVVLSISVIAYYSLNQAQKGTQRIQSEYDKLVDITQIYSQLVEVELSFNKILYNIQNPQETEIIKQSQAVVGYCLKYLNHPTNNLEQGYVQHLIADGRTIISFLESSNNNNSYQVNCGEYLSEMKNLVSLLQKETKTNQRIQDLKDRSRRHALRFLISGAMLSFVAAFIFVYLFSRVIYNPIISLHQGAKHISNGNLGFQLEIPSSDEIGELAQEFNHMSLQLKKSYADLEAQLERRSEKLKEFESHLSRSERLASVGRLAAGIAHEINNPLTLIGACTDGLIHRTSDPQLKSVQAFAPFIEYLKKIDEEVYRCKKITGGLLNFAKEQPSEIQEIEIYELISNTLLLLNQEAMKQQKRLKLEGEQTALVQMDPFMIKQVLINLVMNALEASPNNAEVIIRYWITEKELKIEVEDHGQGIDPTIMGKIFDPFFTTKESGIGLGLAICYGLAKKHGGIISAVSPGKGKGSLFRLHLPLTSKINIS
ncbi:MAG: ATP-binding protein [Planctomycetota bacterium]